MKLLWRSTMGARYSTSLLGSSDRPLRLVSIDPETGRLQADWETISILRGFHHPLAVVGAVGASGSGKSSLLTRIMQNMAREATGFPTSPRPDPCTQGLWISSRALITKKAERHAVLFLDTQGLFSPGQQRRDMCHTLCLAILLSSVLIYNEPGRISNFSLEMLTLSAAAAALLRAHPLLASHANKAVTAISKHSPALFWVLRDACFAEGASADAYLQEVTAHSAPEENHPEPYRNSVRRIF